MKHPRGWFYLPIVVVAVGSIVFGPRLAEMRSVHDAVPVAATPSQAAAATRQDAQQRFDYFPDHYVNQAKEASAPMDQF